MGQTVEDHIARTYVEGVAYPVAVEGDVAEAAEVQARFVAAEQQLVADGHQRGALSAHGHVGSAEVANGGDAGEGRDDGTAADLHRKAVVGLVENRLPVRRDEVRTDGGHLQKPVDLGGSEGGEVAVEQHQVESGERVGGGQATTELVAQIHGVALEDVVTPRIILPRETAQSHIQPVQRRPGHHAQTDNWQLVVHQKVALVF